MSSFKWFYEILQEILKDKKISTKELANFSHINYARLLQIIKGKKQMTTEELTSLIKHPIFNEDEQTLLVKMHHDFDYTLEHQKQLNFVESVMSNLYNTVIQRDSLPIMKCGAENGDKLHKVQTVCQLINDQLFRSYNYALRKVLIGQEELTFKVAFYLPSMDPLIHEVYQTLQALKGCVDPRIKLDLIFYVDLYENSLQERLEQMLNLSKFMKFCVLENQVSLHCLETPLNETECYNYHVHFNDRKVLINDNATEAIVVMGDQSLYFEKLKTVDDRVLAQYCNATDLNNRLFAHTLDQNYFDMPNHTLRFSFSSWCFDLRQYKELLLGLKPEERMKPHMNDFLMKYEQRLNMMAKKIELPNKAMQYLCARGVEHFLEDGVLNDFVELIGAFAPYERIILLYSTLKKIRNGFDLKLVPGHLSEIYPFLKALQYYEFQLEFDQLTIIQHLSYKEAHLVKGRKFNLDGRTIEYAMVIDDPIVIDSFKFFFNEILSKLTMNTKETIEHLKKLADKHFLHSDDERILNVLRYIQGTDNNAVNINIQ